MASRLNQLQTTARLIMLKLPPVWVNETPISVMLQILIWTGFDYFAPDKLAKVYIVFAMIFDHKVKKILTPQCA